MHSTAPTSLEHYKKYDASGLYALIKNKMREDAEREWCIADLAEVLGLEKSTVSARLRELHEFGEIEYTRDRPSRTTGIRSKHYQLRMQPHLL